MTSLNYLKVLNFVLLETSMKDVSLLENRTCSLLFRLKGLYQLVTKPTCDSGTLIDHVYARRTLQIKTDVSDCYYSDHDFVLVNIN